MIGILQMILDALWIVVKIGLLITVCVFLYGFSVGCIDYARKHKKND